MAKDELTLLGEFELAQRQVEVSASRDDIWAFVRRPGGKGAIALRAAHLPGGAKSVAVKRTRAGEKLRVSAQSSVAQHEIGFRVDQSQLPLLRVTHDLTPDFNLLISFLPRDLYVLDNDDDPTGAVGCVEASQRGLNSGLCYFRMTQPQFGTVLYFQNLTAMNDYYAATKSKPDAAVGGRWPELGYLPPTPPQSATPPENPLPAGEQVTVSDALMVFHDDSEAVEANGARRFLQMLGAAYRQLDLPSVAYRDWAGRAEQTLKDLREAPEAHVRHYGHTYIRPYTAAEYPDVMVQVGLATALSEWAPWNKEAGRLAERLARGWSKFYDPKLKMLGRYLPNVGKDKDPSAVDSWYLYYPMLDLGRLAIEGDKRARRLLLKSVDYGIRAAHHFKYWWPIQYKCDTFEVIKEARNKDGLGQTDVAGLYAYVMLQLFQLTNETRFLDEATKAIRSAKGMRFELEYQANLTAWGAAACARLWRVTGDDEFLQQGYVYLASFFHNCEIWQSEIEAAKHYSNFLGATALHDAPYMAMFECSDSFAALEAYLRDGGPQLDQAARTLVSEYCRYALHRAWYYYPDALPKEILATKIRNGHIDRKLSFPLEDLYPDGQKAGQVGQEIYGAGAAFTFARRSFHDLPGIPFLIYCDHFATARELTSERSMMLQLTGGNDCEALLCMVARGRSRLPDAVVTISAGDRIRPRHKEAGRAEYGVPANGQVMINW